MPLEEFINCLDTIILQITNKSIPCDRSIIGTLLDNAELIYKSETGAASDYYMNNYRLLAENESCESVIAMLNLLSGHLKLISAKNNLYNGRNIEFHKLKCIHSKLLNDLKVEKYRDSNPDALDYSNAFNGKGCIYSVITGGYDSIRTPTYINEDMDYILFTDNPNLQSDGIWQIRLIDNPQNLSSHLLSRHVKVFPHLYLAEYDYSLYVDGNLALIGDVHKLISIYHKKESMICNSHDERDCIYDEAVACLELGKDTKDVVDRHVSHLRDNNYPERNGLIIGGYLIRSHRDEKLKKVMSDWWEMITNYSKRDQLSFNYVAWKNEYMYDSTDLAFCSNEFFEYSDH